MENLAKNIILLLFILSSLFVYAGESVTTDKKMLRINFINSTSENVEGWFEDSKAQAYVVINAERKVSTHTMARSTLEKVFFKLPDGRKVDCTVDMPKESRNISFVLKKEQDSFLCSTWEKEK